MAREPHAIYLETPKPTKSIRVLVFGESAAFGDPQPAFGLPRMIEAMLELRHPGRKFEVVNAAMTAINSHVIRPMARDCVAAGADVWVLYIGNNEVVGPFGAGTVFGQQTLPLPLIRADLELKRLRIGQVLESLLDHESDAEWGGMMMFMKQQLPLSDPRMTGVYRNFESNLRDIVSMGKGSGAGIVLCTVAVNLRDCPPFASAHGPAWNDSMGKEWQQLCENGLAARRENNTAEALDLFRKAVALDEQYADTRFQLGQLKLKSGLIREAAVDFEAARDCDTLRFRCDSRLNQTIRTVGNKMAAKGLELADVGLALGDKADENNFYDHVHLTFEGNYAAAREIVPRIESLLTNAELDSGSSSRQWPSIKDCATRLGWSEVARRAAWLEMLPRLTDPPFVNQMDHQARVEWVGKKIQALSSSLTSEAIRTALQTIEDQAAALPKDPDLQMQLSILAETAGQTNLAVQAAERATQLLPTSIEAWRRLAATSEKAGNLAAAAQASRRIISINGDAYYAYNNLGRIFSAQGDTARAIEAYGQTLKMKPRFGPAWLSLGELLEKSGKKDEAQQSYAQALHNRVRSAPELTRLANFCRERGWNLAAATNLAEATSLGPPDPPALLKVGQDFALAGSHADAMRYFKQACTVAPNYGPAHFLMARELGLGGDLKSAEEEFRTAVQLMPDVAEARINLAVTLAKQGRKEEAAAEYDAILRQWPTNQLARRNLEALHQPTAVPGVKP